MDKREILDAIKRMAIANGGKAPGRLAFERETGIRRCDWYPHLWLRWGEALVEAGYSANRLQTAISKEVVIQKFIDLASELGRIPVEGETRRKAKTDKSFPHSLFQRAGGKEKLLEAVVRYCEERPGNEDIIALCAARSHPATAEINERGGAKVTTGFVYLMKSGRHYKIGHTVSVGRRQREFAIQIPIPPKTIHSIETDDPLGVEAYGTIDSAINAAKANGSICRQKISGHSNAGSGSFDRILREETRLRG